MSDRMIVNKFLDNIEDPKLTVSVEITCNFAYSLTLDEVADHMQRNMDAQRRVSNRYIHSVSRNPRTGPGRGRQGARGTGRGGRSGAGRGHGQGGDPNRPGYVDPEVWGTWTQEQREAYLHKCKEYNLKSQLSHLASHQRNV
jgi:hypothetical protein